jgi:hypothetical protein
MVSLSFSRLAAVVSAFTYLGSVMATPAPMFNETIAGYAGLGHHAREILQRSTPAAPYFVIYGDKYVSGTTGPPATSAITVGISLFFVSDSLLIYAFDYQGFNVLYVYTSQRRLQC